MLAVVAQGANFHRYVNNKLFAQVTDTSYSCGQIVVAAEDHGDTTVVVFSDAKAWKL